MTEAEWLASNDPQAMLHCLAVQSVPGHVDGIVQRPSDRKLRLFACACWRLRPSVRARHPTAIEVLRIAERVAEGGALPVDRPRAGTHDALDYVPLLPDAFDAAQESCSITAELRTEEAVLLREIVGNPFRPVKLPYCCLRCGCSFFEPEVEYAACANCGWSEFGCPWLPPAALSLARVAYSERPGRECEKCKAALARLATASSLVYRECVCGGTGRVLADALEEAGATDDVETIEFPAVLCCPDCGDAGFWRAGQEFDHMRKCRRQECGTVWVPGEVVKRKVTTPNPLLAHLRSPGPHVRGCWALDLILGKE